MWKGREMIKGRGCREDVEGKGDGQAMVVCCRPVLALCVVALSALVLHVVTSALHVLVASFSHIITWLCHGVIISSPVSQCGGLGRRWEGGAYCVVFKIRSNDEQRISVIIHHLVATSLSATWHLVSVLDMSVEGR